MVALQSGGIVPDVQHSTIQKQWPLSWQPAYVILNVSLEISGVIGDAGVIVLITLYVTAV